MPDLDPFLEQIRANPGDEALRLVYADWLEERGDARADFLRGRRQWQQLPPGDGLIEPLGRRLDATSQHLDEAWLEVVEGPQVIPEMRQSDCTAWVRKTPAGLIHFWALWPDHQLSTLLTPLGRRWFPAFLMRRVELTLDDVSILMQQLGIASMPTLLYHAGGAIKKTRRLKQSPQSYLDARIRTIFAEMRRHAP